MFLSKKRAEGEHVAEENHHNKEAVEEMGEVEDANHEIEEEGLEDDEEENGKMDEVEDIKQQKLLGEIKEDEEQEEPFAQEKADSIAMRNKVSEAVTKIEETVARHKAEAECLKLSSENPVSYDKQLHHAAKINRYDTGMSSEFLMKHLMQLDNCLSYGCASIKSSRRALVCRIKQAMSQADSLSQQWLERAKVFDKLKAQLSSTVCPDKTTATGGKDQVIGMEEEKTGNESTDEWDADPAHKMQLGETSDDVKDNAITSSNSQTPSPCTPDEDSAPEMEDDEISDDELEEDANTSRNNETSGALPSYWRPHTQLYHNDSHVVVAAHVPGMKMEQFNIMIDATDLVVRGNKKPTWKEFEAYRRGAPQCFGNLNVKIPIPVNVVHTEGATATYEDGILRVKFLKKQTPRHRYRRPAPRQYYRDRKSVV